MKVAALVLGAGRGKRMGAGRNKIFLPLCGVPVIIRSLQALAPYCQWGVLAAAPDDMGEMAELLKHYALEEKFTLAEGGHERQDSVRLGLMALPKDTDIVLIHDGARPLVPPEVILSALDSARQRGSGVAALPVTDTVRKADGSGRITEDLKRSELFAMQTPQAFSYALIWEAHMRALHENFYSTDDAALLHHMGLPVYLSPGSPENIKITAPQDMLYAKMLLEERMGRGGTQE